MMTSPREDRRRLWRIVGTCLGWLLLAAAIVVVVRQRDTMASSLEAIANPDPRTLALLALAVVGNVVLSALFLHGLLRRYGKVGVGEMHAVVAAAALMNYLPLRPGLVGRVAYHRAVNGIPVASTVRTVVESLVISASIAGYVAVVAAFTAWRGSGLELGVLAPFPVLLVAAILRPARLWAWVIGLRHAEVLLWAWRYHLAFNLIDAPIAPTTALALAAVSVIANMMPFVSNGLGLREWAVGALAPMLAPVTLGVSVTAELVNRGVEIIVIAIIGSAGLWWVYRRWRGVDEGEETSSPGS